MSDLAKRKRARLTKFTPTTKATIIENVSRGLPIKSAAALAGVHPTTVYGWLSQGAEDPSSQYAVFAVDVAAAQANHKLRLLEKIEQIGFEKDQWAALMTTLERVYQDEFKRPAANETNVTVQVGVLEQRVHELVKKGELSYTGG